MTNKNKIQKIGPRVKLGGRIAVVPRACCRFERIWMPSAGKAGVEALEFQLKRETSTASESFFVEPSNLKGPGHINVWFADDGLVRQFTQRSPIWAPETFMREPHPAGVRLIRCIEGYEGQIWRDYRLVTSRWWEETPTDIEWSLFVDGADISAGLPDSGEQDWYAPPIIEDAPWRSDLSVLSIGNRSLSKLFSPVRIAGFALLLLALPTVWLAGSYLKISVHNNRVEEQLSALSDQSARLERIRREAFETRSTPDALGSLGDTLAIIDALAVIKDAVQNGDVHVDFVELSGKIMEVRLSGVDPRTIPEIIQSLDASENWREVSAATNRAGQIVVRGTIEGLPEGVRP